MNKSELIEAVTDRIGDRKTAAAAVDAVFDTITSTVAAGERVALTGFGVFEKAERKARTARNPATGAVIKLKKTSLPRFRAGQGFKDVVSGARKLPTPTKAASAARSAATGSAKAALSAVTAPGKAAVRAASPGRAKPAAAKKAPAKKAAATKAPAKKAPATMGAAAKAPAKKAAAKKAPTKRAPAKKAASR